MDFLIYYIVKENIWESINVRIYEKSPKTYNIDYCYCYGILDGRSVSYTVGF